MARGALRRKSNRSVAAHDPARGRARGRGPAGQQSGRPLQPRATAGAPIEPGDRVVITGAAGFIGSAVTRAVLAAGAHVVAVDRARRRRPEPRAGLDVERVSADIRDRRRDPRRSARARATSSTSPRSTAFWARDPRIFDEVNVGGTLNVIDAVRAAGCERMVYTCTVGVLGLHGTKAGLPADETAYADIGHLFGYYKRTKYVAEHEVLRAAGEGSGCRASRCRPSRSGRATRARPRPARWCSTSSTAGCPAFVDTGMNVVPRRRPRARSRRGAGARPRRAAATSSAARTCRCGRSCGRWPTARGCRCRACGYRAGWSSRPGSSRTWSRAGCCGASRTCRLRAPGWRRPG